MQPYRGGFLVTDGHHNRVLRVTLDGGITEVIAFDNIVPTGIDLRPDKVYLAQAGPVPHLPEDGKVVSFTPPAAVKSRSPRERPSSSTWSSDRRAGCMPCHRATSRWGTRRAHRRHRTPVRW